MPPKWIVNPIEEAYLNAKDMIDAACRDPRSKLYNVPDSGGRERAAHAHNNALVDGLVKGAPPSDVPIGKQVI